MKRKSFFVTTFSFESGAQKLGQPVPDLNFSLELNSGSPDTIST